MNWVNRVNFRLCKLFLNKKEFMLIIVSLETKEEASPHSYLEDVTVGDPSAKKIKGVNVQCPDDGWHQ